MKILKSDLIHAAEKKIINLNQANELWFYFNSLRPNQVKFNLSQLLYYFGGILIVSSMSWFLTQAWDNGQVIMMISSIFAFFYILSGNFLWNKTKYKIPGGLLISAAVSLTPLFVYGLQKHLGFFSDNSLKHYTNYHFFIKNQWIYMEIATIIVALIALQYYKFTFLIFPLALSFWYLSMDVAPIFVGKLIFSYQQKQLVSCVVGIIILVIAYFIDQKYKKQDFAFWLYLSGMASFWGALSSMDSNSELAKFLYMVLNVFFVFLSIFLRRKIFILCGFLGIFGYLAHLAYDVFKDSYFFSIAILLIGTVVISIGIFYQKNKQQIEDTIIKIFPKFLFRFRPEERV